MNHAAELAAMELLMDATRASSLPRRKHAGWKRDQHMRRARPEPLEFIADATDAGDCAAVRMNAARGFST